MCLKKNNPFFLINRKKMHFGQVLQLLAQNQQFLTKQLQFPPGRDNLQKTSLKTIN